MKSIKCSEVKKEIYFYVKNELELKKKADIENHIAECSACRSSLDEFSKTLGVVDKIALEYPRKNWDFFAEQILDRIYRTKRFVFWKPVLAFVLSLFVFVIGYRYYHQKNLQGTVVSSDTEEIVSYLSNFDIPELNQ